MGFFAPRVWEKGKTRNCPSNLSCPFTNRASCADVFWACKELKVARKISRTPFKLCLLTSSVTLRARNKSLNGNACRQILPKTIARCKVCGERTPGSLREKLFSKSLKRLWISWTLPLTSAGFASITSTQASKQIVFVFWPSVQGEEFVFAFIWNISALPSSSREKHFLSTPKEGAYLSLVWRFQQLSASSGFFPPQAYVVTNVVNCLPGDVVFKAAPCRLLHRHVWVCSFFQKWPSSDIISFSHRKAFPEQCKVILLSGRGRSSTIFYPKISEPEKKLLVKCAEVCCWICSTILKNRFWFTTCTMTLRLWLGDASAALHWSRDIGYNAAAGCVSCKVNGPTLKLWLFPIDEW